MIEAQQSQAIVYVVDDDAGMRKSIQLLLGTSSFDVRLFEAAEQAIDAIDTRRSGCMVLDLRMPGMGGMELLRRLKERLPDFPIILISGHADVATAVRGMRLGALDLLEKPFEPQALIDAVRNALETSKAAVQRRAEVGSMLARFDALTERERQLLKMVVAGKPSKQIARELGISLKTVANHRASVMAKTQASNAADLARLATAAGLTQETA